MSLAKYDTKNIDGDSPVIGVAAGTAANTTYTEYIDMQYYDACTLQIEWTAGAGGGTLALKIYGTIQDDTTAAASCAYQDITNDLFGVATITGDAICVDGDAVCGNLKFLKVEGTIGNKDASTALYVYGRKKKND